jgi:hypothetical protein
MPKTEEPKVPLIDLTGICRTPDKLYCHVDVELPYGYRAPWLKLGAVGLCHNSCGNTWNLSARMDATDFEHSSLYALSLILVGLTLKYVTNHHFLYEAYLHPNPDNFYVPNEGYDPRKLKGVTKCKGKDCDRGPHLMVPDGNYVPKPNLELFKLVRYGLLLIRIGPVEPEAEE